MKKTKCGDPYEFVNWMDEYEDGPEYEVPGETYASEHKDGGGIVHFVTTYINNELFQYKVEGASTLKEAAQFAREG